MTNEQTMTHPRGWTGKEGMAGTLFCGTDGMNDIAAIFGRMEANCPAPIVHFQKAVATAASNHHSAR